eukprot:TRINITY_DN693_c0_g2_i2.p1 TRINITY_DN693_c0_g2~~TRINITY_DN693_c0_g2_i2.p1  ORF type:complete len:130 (-),score=15.53 TRINITY_DN693_c0_g2_i2:124-513(-)
MIRMNQTRQQYKSAAVGFSLSRQRYLTRFEFYDADGNVLPTAVIFKDPKKHHKKPNGVGSSKSLVPTRCCACGLIADKRGLENMFCTYQQQQQQEVLCWSHVALYARGGCGWPILTAVHRKPSMWAPEA